MMLVTSIALLVTQAAAPVEALATRPTIKPLPAVSVTRPQRFKLPNGTDVQAVPRHVAPLVVISVLVRAGSAADPADKAGLAAATADMMDEGAGTRSALELARDLETLGAQLSLSAGRDGSRLTLQTPVAGLSRALELMADVLATPRFEEAEWKRVKNDRLTGLVQRRDEPGAVASVVAGRVLYGDEHPYGHPPEGYVKSVEAITRDDLAAFHQTHWRPDAATVIAAGDFQVPALKAELLQALARWKKPATPLGKSVGKFAAVTGKPSGKRPRFVLVDRPGAPQTVVRFLGPGVPRRSPARPPLTLASTILGGSFTSRLNSNLREDKGYTYGAFGGFNYNREAGAFTTSADVHTKVTDASVVEILKELRLIHDQPLKTDELTKARAITLVNTAESLSTTGGIAGLFSDTALMGEPPDAPERFLKAIAGKNADAVKSAVAANLNLDDLTLVVVGDRSVIEAPLAAAGWKAPEVRDPDGDVIP